MDQHELSAVIFKRGDWWIGQCLQHDIGAHARTLKQVRYELERAIVAHIVICENNGVEPFTTLSEAPRRYWKIFEDGIALRDPDPTEFVMQGRRRQAPASEVRVSELTTAPA